MPKLGLHYISAQRALANLRSMQLPDLFSKKFTADEITQYDNLVNVLNRNEKYYNLGAIGPDIMFFGTDYEDFNKITQVINKFNEFKQLYEDIMDPIEAFQDQVSDQLSDTLDALGLPDIPALLAELEVTRGDIESILFSGAQALLISMSDFGEKIFEGIFAPEFQKSLNKNQSIDFVEKDWMWFDILHYRKTGEFAEQLIRNAKNSEIKTAFAFGYLTHYATDFIGHGYVNEVVGGPYRLNVQRHVVTENFMDTWAFNEFYNERLTDTFLSEDRMDLDPALHPDISYLINKTMNDVYPSSNYPIAMSTGDLATTYNNMLTWFDISYQSMRDPPTPPFEDVNDFLAEILEQIIPPRPPQPPNTIGGGGCSPSEIFNLDTGPDCFNEFFSNLSDWVEYFVELSRYSLELLLHLLTLINRLFNVLTVGSLLALLYLIRLTLYGLYQDIRYIMALNGLVYPDPTDLNNAVGQQFLSTQNSCYSANNNDYPKMRESGMSHIVCPTGNEPYPDTKPNHYSSATIANPAAKIIGNKFNLKSFSQYSNAGDPSATRNFSQDIGEASEYATILMTMSHIKIQSPFVKPPQTSDVFNFLLPNWNLDVDRGYAYKTWRLKNEQDGSITDEYVDLRKKST